MSLDIETGIKLIFILIVVSLRRFTLFPLISLVILASAEVFFLLAYCQQRRHVNALISGILFVIGGTGYRIRTV